MVDDSALFSVALVDASPDDLDNFTMAKVDAGSKFHVWEDQLGEKISIEREGRVGYLGGASSSRN